MILEDSTSIIMEGTMRIIINILVMHSKEMVIKEIEISHFKGILG